MFVTKASLFCRTFISKHLPPIQFKNPNVQMVTFKNTTTNPAINVYFGQWHAVLCWECMQAVSTQPLSLACSLPLPCSLPQGMARK